MYIKYISLYQNFFHKKSIVRWAIEKTIHTFLTNTVLYQDLFHISANVLYPNFIYLFCF